MLRTAVAAALGLSLASPVGAATLLFGGAPVTVSSISQTVGDVGFTLTARRFSVTPTALTSFSQLGSALNISRTLPGVGVAGGASGPQLDTNQVNRREAFVFQFSAPIELAGLRLSYVDSNDTLLFFGVRPEGDLVPLITTGTIRTGLGGAATAVNQNGLNQGTTTLTFVQPWGWFDRYVLTTRVGGEELFNGDRGQGFRLDSLTVALVPEPATWALMIAGFGLVGFAARRRSVARTGSLPKTVA